MTVTVLIHAILGSLALTIGTLAAFSRKGGKRHKAGGRVFFISLLLSNMLALWVSYEKNITFLFGIGLFTVYLIITGYLYGYIKTFSTPKRTGIGLLGLSFAVYMGDHAYNEGSLNVVTTFFSLLLLIFSLTDFRTTKPKTRIIRHAGRSGGALIASYTAFLVVNVKVGPGWLLWILPTLLGSLFIAYSINRFFRPKVT